MSAVLAPLLLLLAAATDDPVAPPPPPATAPAPAPATATVTGSPATAPLAEALPAAPPVVGGFTQVDPRARELAPAVKAAVTHLTPARHARARVLAAERQVVAGLNYRLLLKLRDGSQWRVTVWQKLDRSLQVIEAVRAAS